MIFSACEKGWRPVPDTLDEELNHALKRGLDGVIVYVNQPGKQQCYSAGWKNRENRIPADPKAYFKIASISKMYLAAASAKLIASDVLTLDQTLAELLPHLKHRITNADRITLRMLLQHRSGIFNFTEHPDYPWTNPPQSNEAILQLALDRPADFEPDSRYMYSNTNFLLIGAILDSTLGYSHHLYINTEILEPLDLQHTYHLMKEIDLAELTSGYFVGYEPDIKYNDFIQPGGSMVASAEDAGRFVRALIDGSLLSQKEQEIYTSVYPYEHTGLLPGYQSIVRYHPQIDAVLVMFVNTSGANSWWKMEQEYKRVVKILEKQK